MAPDFQSYFSHQTIMDIAAGDLLGEIRHQTMPLAMPANKADAEILDKPAWLHSGYCKPNRTSNHATWGS